MGEVSGVDSRSVRAGGQERQRGPRHRARRGVLSAATVTLLLTAGAACGNDLASSETVTAYFDALASNDADRIPELLEVAEEGSAAYLFAVHLAHVATAFATDPEPLSADSPGTWERVGDTVRIAYGPDRDQSRGYADFEVDPETGRLVAFSESQPADSEHWVPITQTRVAGDGTAVAVFDATVELLTASKPAWSPQLWAALEVRSGDQALWINAEDRALVTVPGRAPAPGAATTYLAPSGDAQVLHAVFGVTDVAPRSTTVLVLVFEDVPLGGTIVLPIGSEGELVDAQIPVPAPPS